MKGPIGPRYFITHNITQQCTKEPKAQKVPKKITKMTENYPKAYQYKESLKMSNFRITPMKLTKVFKVQKY